MPMPDLQLSYWGERGFARAMALCTGAEPSGEYPTQDKHTPADESDFITGFNLGKKMFDNFGFEVAVAYMNEKDQQSHG